MADPFATDITQPPAHAALATPSPTALIGGKHQVLHLDPLSAVGGGPGKFSQEHFDAFRSFARSGRMRQAGEKGELKPSEADLSKAQSAIDYVCLYGYSEPDIAAFYLERRGGHPVGYYEYLRDYVKAVFSPVNK